MRWQVGDGRCIRIWQDQWLSTRSTYRVVTPERAGNHVQMVQDLMSEEKSEWNTVLVKEIFLPQDAEAILSIPISETRARDRMVWAGDKKGNFTVRSAYRLAREIDMQGRNSGCSDQSMMQGVWREV